jgi:hypothetical protein
MTARFLLVGLLTLLVLSCATAPLPPWAALGYGGLRDFLGTEAGPLEVD